MGKRVKASELRVGNSISVPGRELHDDLSGLVVHLSVDKIARGDGITRIYDAHSESWTWFRDDEEVMRG